jgi:hypothetical protein
MAEARRRLGHDVREGMLDWSGRQQADRADESVDAVWLGHDWASTRNGTYARTSLVAERIRKREIERTPALLYTRRCAAAVESGWGGR